MFAVFGGNLMNGYSNDLYILNLTSSNWTAQPNNGDVPPALTGSTLSYYNGFLYLVAGEVSNSSDPSVKYFSGTYRYDLVLQKWKKLSGDVYKSRYYSGSEVIGSFLYLFYGYTDEDSSDVSSIMRLDLSSPTYNWKSVSMQNSNQITLIRNSYAISSKGQSVYLFGGKNTESNKIFNSLIELDLNTSVWGILANDSSAPSARIFCSLEIINGDLYLFGGISGSTYLNDLWVFDLDTMLWESVKAQGAIPSPRSSHASGSEGDIMIIWGGIGSSGSLSDLNQFNVLTLTWTAMTPDGSSIPSGRSEACIGVYMPYLVIFGGNTISGYTNEVWSYYTGSNTYTLLSPSSSDFSTISYPNCEIVYDAYNNPLLYAMFGYTTAEQPLGGIRFFNLSDLTWTTIFDQGYLRYNRAMGLYKVLSNNVILISGESWSTNAYTDIFIYNNTSPYSLSQNNQGPTKIGYSQVYVYGSGSTYYKTSIYSFGGGSTLGTSLRSSVSNNFYYRVDLRQICEDTQTCEAFCSKGTYLLDSECVKCPKGSYSDTYSNSACTLCPPGTYNNHEGANSNLQCYPCPEGSFNSIEGAAICLNCPIEKSCPIGSKAPYDYQISNLVSSVQPTVYTKNSSDASNAVNILIYAILSFSIVFLVILLLFFETVWKNLKIFDIYKKLHNYKLLEPMVLSKNSCGGLFGVIFIIIALFLIISMLISFELNNVEELKSLMTSTILEHQVESFNAWMFVQITLYRYGGRCVDSSGSCLPEISLNIYNIVGTTGSKKCYFDSQNNCIVEYTCTSCAINSGAYIEGVFSEELSYSSGLSVNLTTTSSIPNSISSIYEVLVPPTGTVFRGYTPSTFYFTATPSLFLHEQGDPNPLTGYHISSEISPEVGSSYLVIELPFTFNLKILIELSKSDTSLYTLRYQNQTPIILINGLLGSVFGVLSLMGTLMRTAEWSMNYYKSHRDKKKKFKKILYQDIDYKYQCTNPPDPSFKYSSR
jgi:Galactose oxidase, central domain/Tyrosine-protein kinase ephrin type A/B receptor-like